MSEFVRCSSGDASPAWTCVLPAGHDDGHIYSPWSQIAAMAEAEIRLRESAMQRVQELHHPVPQQAGVPSGHPVCDGCGFIYPCATIRALDGGESDE